MAKKPDTREFTDAGVSSTRSMRDAMGDTDNYRTQRRLLATGNEVTLRTKGGEPQVWGETEDELYLDNGFVDPGFWSAGATVAEAQYLATDFNGDTTTSYLAVKNKLKPPFIPKVWKALFKSFSTRGSLTTPPKPEKVDALKKKNIAILTCPPAMFTGLMRRYVSALYGKKVTDAAARELEVVDLGAYGYLKYDGITIDPGQTTSGIVYSETHRKYWWVVVSGTTMVYQEMTFSELGHEVLRKMFVTGLHAPTPAEKKLLQTYALSEARILRNDDDDNVDWRDGGSFPQVLGVPLNLGWRFNSTGSQFAAVAIDQYGDHVTDSRLYVGTISITEDTNIPKGNPARFTLAVSMAISEAVLGWQSNRIRVFKPEAGAAYRWVRTGPVDNSVTAAPLLAFFDDDDVLQVCRYSRNPGRPSPEKVIELSGKWGPSSNMTYTVPNGYSVPGPCGPLDGQIALGTYGMGESGVVVTDYLTGDNASTTLGSISGSETHFTNRFEGNYGLSTVSIDYTLVEADHQYYGAVTPVPGSPNEINGTAACAPQYFPDPGGATVGYYTTYYRYLSGDGTGKSYTTGTAKTYQTVVVAPQDCATAWYEMGHHHEQTGTILNTTFHAEPQTCSHKYVANGMTFLTEHGVNWGVPTDVAATPAVDTGTTTIVCNTGHGMRAAGVVSTTGGPAAYKFFGVTEIAPVINVAVITYEDQISSNAVTNLDTETLIRYGWSATCTRPVGWQ